MASSHSDINLHLVWATYRRLPLVTARVERPLYACIEQEVNRSGCEVLAIGGVADHIHLAVWMPTHVPASALMQRVKGVSSTLGRTQLVAPGDIFRWQSGFGAFSFSRSQRDRVIDYVRDQKQRHAGGTLWIPWEVADAEE